MESLGQTCVGYIQGKCPMFCTISLVLIRTLKYVRNIMYLCNIMQNINSKILISIVLLTYYLYVILKIISLVIHINIINIVIVLI